MDAKFCEEQTLSLPLGFSMNKTQAFRKWVGNVLQLLHKSAVATRSPGRVAAWVGHGLFPVQEEIKARGLTSTPTAFLNHLI